MVSDVEALILELFGICNMPLLQEGRSVQRPKRCLKHGDKDEDSSPKNVNNEKIFNFELLVLDSNTWNHFNVCK